MNREIQGTRRTCAVCGAAWVAGIEQDAGPGRLGRWYLMGDERRVCWVCLRKGSQAQADSSAQTELRALDTAAGFLSERRDFLHVYVTRSVGDGDGWDVVLRIDGTYFDRAEAEAVAEGAIRPWIERLTDVRKDKWHWWHGPPWRRSR